MSVCLKFFENFLKIIVDKVIKMCYNVNTKNEKLKIRN